MLGYIPEFRNLVAVDSFGICLTGNFIRYQDASEHNCFVFLPSINKARNAQWITVQAAIVHVSTIYL